MIMEVGECIPKYQEMPVIIESESEYEVPDKIYIPYPDDLLEDCITNMKIIRPEDFEIIEHINDFCSAKNPYPPYEAPEPHPDALESTWYVWRPMFIETYRPPVDMVFEGWGPEVLGMNKCKPWPKLCSREEAIEKFCPLNMDKQGSAWSEDMCMSDMYQLALKCPCSDVRCGEILLRLRNCESLKYRVKEDLDFLLE